MALLEKTENGIRIVKQTNPKPFGKKQQRSTKGNHSPLSVDKSANKTKIKEA